MSIKWNRVLENKIIKMAVKNVLKSGYIAQIWDDNTLAYKGKNLNKIIDTTNEFDDCMILFDDKNSGSHAWIKLTFGNCQDVISDYTLNIEKELQSAILFSEKW